MFQMAIMIVLHPKRHINIFVKIKKSALVHIHPYKNPYRYTLQEYFIVKHYYKGSTSV